MIGRESQICFNQIHILFVLLFNFSFFPIFSVKMFDAKSTFSDINHVILLDFAVIRFVFSSFRLLFIKNEQNDKKKNAPAFC